MLLSTNAMRLFEAGSWDKPYVETILQSESNYTTAEEEDASNSRTPVEPRIAKSCWKHDWNMTFLLVLCINVRWHQIRVEKRRNALICGNSFFSSSSRSGNSASLTWCLLCKNLSEKGSTFALFPKRQTNNKQKNPTSSERKNFWQILRRCHTKPHWWKHS